MSLDDRGRREATAVLADHYRRNITRAEALRVFAGLGLTAVGGSWLAGCGGDGAKGAGAGAAAGAKPAVPTGKLEFLSAENLLGRWDTTGHTNLAHLKLEANVFDFLLNADARKQLVPGLATEWRYLNPKTIEFKLREGVKFHDGADFTAKDVKAAIEYASRPKALTNNWFPLKRQVNVEVVDDHTVRLKTDFPAGGLLYSLAMIPIQSAKDIQKPSVLNERMNGTGPFKWVDYKGESGGVVLTTNQDYWGGKPLIKDFVFRYVGDSSTRLAALHSGEANAIDRVEPDQIKVIEGNANLKLDRQLTIENKWFHFRNTIAPFKDDKVLRQALAHAIDKQAIVDKILLGSGKVADSHVSPEQFGYAPAPNNITFDPEKAKSLLAQAGYPNGRGLPELEYVTSVGFYPKTKEYGQFIVDSMKEIGVNMRLTTKEVASWNECLYVADCGSAIDSGWLPTSLDPDVVLISQFYKGGIINGIDSPRVTKALEAESFEVDAEKRAKAMAEQTIPVLMDEVPSFPLFVSELVIGMHKSVNGLDQLGNGYFFLKDAYIGS